MMRVGRAAKRRRLAPTTVWVLGLAGLALMASGCATPVGVQPVDIQTAYRLHTVSALSAGQPSEPSQTVLRRLGLLDQFDEAPADCGDGGLHMDARLGSQRVGRRTPVWVPEILALRFRQFWHGLTAVLREGKSAV